MVRACPSLNKMTVAAFSWKLDQLLLTVNSPDRKLTNMTKCTLRIEMKMYCFILSLMFISTLILSLCD